MCICSWRLSKKSYGFFLSPGNKRDTHFTTEDLKSLGYHVCDTLLDFCDPDRTKVKMGSQDRRWCHWDRCHTGPKSAQWGDRWSLFSSSYFSEVFIIKDSEETSVCTLPANGKPSSFPGSGGRSAPPMQPLPRSWASLWQHRSSLPSLLSQKIRRPFSSPKPSLPSVHLPASPVVSLRSCLINHLFSFLGLFLFFFTFSSSS